MDLYIRSQNKEKLVKVNELMAFDSNILENDFVLNNNKPDYSNMYIIANDNYNLGTYKSKERALEVLNEIQNILMPKTILKFDKHITQEDLQILKKGFEEQQPILLNKSTIEHLDTYVYEMPEE